MRLARSSGPAEPFPIPSSAAIRELVDGQLVFIPTPTQRQVLREIRNRYGKHAALQQYFVFRDDSIPDELAQMDPRRLKELLLRARDGRGYDRAAARIHLRHLMAPLPTVAGYRERARAVEALARNVEAGSRAGVAA